MPTHSETKAFLRDQRGLTSEQADRFRLRLQEFIDDLGQMEAGGRSWFRPGFGSVSRVCQFSWSRSVGSCTRKRRRANSGVSERVQACP